MSWEPEIPEPDEEFESLLSGLLMPLYASGYYVLHPVSSRKFKIGSNWKPVWQFHPDKKRNGPCKCGSGRKFKKCCMKRRNILLTTINE